MGLWVLINACWYKMSEPRQAGPNAVACGSFEKFRDLLLIASLIVKRRHLNIRLLYVGNQALLNSIRQLTIAAAIVKKSYEVKHPDFLNRLALKPSEGADVQPTALAKQINVGSAAQSMCNQMAAVIVLAGTLRVPAHPR